MILWHGSESSPRTLPNGRVLRLVRRQDARQILRGERTLRVSVDGIILAVLAVLGAISLVALTTWFLLRLVFG